MYAHLAKRSVRAWEVAELDLSRLEELIVRVRVKDEWVELRGLPAVDLVMRLDPASLEGRRLRWPRHAWAFHNLVAHPAMQLLAWLGFPRLSGVRLHDATVPRPIGRR